MWDQQGGWVVEFWSIGSDLQKVQICRLEISVINQHNTYQIESVGICMLLQSRLQLCQSIIQFRSVLHHQLTILTQESPNYYFKWVET